MGDDLSTFTESTMKDNTRNLKKMNTLMQRNSNNASVVFTALPSMSPDSINTDTYMDSLNTLSSKYSMIT